MSKRDTIEHMIEVANRHGGECLSSKYKNTDTKLKWQCKEGHVWDATSHHVKAGHWCVICAHTGKFKWNIESMKELAKKHGGEFFSEKYLGFEIKHKWQCKNKHIFMSTPHCIFNGNWCAKCAGLFPLTLVEMQQIAQSKGGKCLSTDYINSVTKLKWQCKNGHFFEMKPNNVKNQGQWCAKCVGLTPLTIEEMQQLAKKHNGICLSKKYINIKSKLLWKCEKGHEFYTTPTHIKHTGSWCPICPNYVNEEKVRNIFQDIFKVPFLRCRPDWLMGLKGRCLELDGYNEKLAVAFEYHGEQHFDEQSRYYKYLNNRGEGAFANRQKLDSLKRELCKKNGIKLIEIPYTIKQSKYREYINKQLAQL